MHSLRELNTHAFCGARLVRMACAAAWIVIALVVFEVVVTCWDEFIENATRILSANERILHVLLTINLGVIALLVVMLAADWIPAAALAGSGWHPLALADQRAGHRVAGVGSTRRLRMVVAATLARPERCAPCRVRCREAWRGAEADDRPGLFAAARAFV